MIWINKPEVLFELDKLKYYMPGPNLTWEEQANSLVRFMIYLSLLLYLAKGNPMHLVIPPLIMMGFQYYMFREGKLENFLTKIFSAKPIDVESPGQKTTITTKPEIEDDDQLIEKFHPDNVKEGSGDLKENFDLSRQRHIKHPLEMNSEWDEYHRSLNADEFNAGGDPEPKKTLGPRPDMALIRGEPPYKPKEIECKPPTKHNPFGNALPYDVVEKQVNRVCPDEFQKDQKFFEGLYNNINDLFDRNNSQRQFTTNPASTRINDREAAIQFFYNTPYTEH